MERVKYEFKDGIMYEEWKRKEPLELTINGFKSKGKIYKWFS